MTRSVSGRMNYKEGGLGREVTVAGCITSEIKIQYIYVPCKVPFLLFIALTEGKSNHNPPKVNQK